VNHGVTITCCSAAALVIAAGPSAGAEPPPSSDTAGAQTGRPGPGVPVPSAPPAVTTAMDGWVLRVEGRDESLVAVPPLTPAASSREYIVGGNFTASTTGPAGERDSQGKLTVGYQVACGLELSDEGVNLSANASLWPNVGISMAGPSASVYAPFGGAVSVGLRPGTSAIVSGADKQFDGRDPWVSVAEFHVSVEGCVGASYIRSVATLTRSTSVSDSVLSYVGTTQHF
jgi:hypothetical protein